MIAAIRVLQTLSILSILSSAYMVTSGMSLFWVTLVSSALAFAGLHVMAPIWRKL